MLQGLQEPLSSLNAAAHVCYRLAKCRLVANNYAFAHLKSTEKVVWHNKLHEELAVLRREYSALLYGGRIPQVVSAARLFQNTCLTI